MKDLPVPAPGQFVASDLKWRVGAHEVRFLGMSGGGVKVPEWDRAEPAEQIAAYFSFPNGVADPYVKVLSIRDQTGKAYRFDAVAPLCGYPTTTRFAIRLPSGVPRAEKFSFKLGLPLTNEKPSSSLNPSSSRRATK